MKRALGTCLLSLFFVAAPVLLPVHADSFTPGHPCHAERTTFYSNATYTRIVGVDEYVCWMGHYVTGQRTPYSIYGYIEQCCAVCANGVCGIEP